MIKKILVIVLIGLMCPYVYADGIEGDYISEDGTRSEDQDLWDGDYISREGQRSGDAVLKNDPAEHKDKVIDKRGGIVSSNEEKKVYEQAGVLVSEPDSKKAEEEEENVDGTKQS